MGLFDLLKKDKLLMTGPVFQGCEKSYAKILSNDLHSELVEECMSKKVVSFFFFQLIHHKINNIFCYQNLLLI